MSVKEKRSVTFEEPTASLLVREPNNNCSSYSFYKADSLPRRRVRSRSWSRLRARWSKVSHERPDLSYEAGVYPQAEFRSLARSRSHSSVRSLVKLFEVLSMSEGRKSQVVLLDDRRLDIIIQPKLFANELLDLVASHFKLKEKQYFGLGFLDETNHFNWLQGEKRVLDHEFPKKAGLLILYFAIKFYIDTIGLLRDIQTVELFYLSARQNISRGHLLCEPEKVFELAAYVLQATNGDFISEEITREELKKLPVIPTGTLKEHPSISYCEDRIIAYYEKINGTSRGLAIVNYMTVVERLSAYGIHYYDVKDKKDIPWCLGVSPKGIAVYDRSDKSTPRKLFHWKSLENLYYKDKKFSIEVHSPRRTSANHRSASNIDVHTWFASTQQLTKCIWSMAVGQHQFYLDSKHNQMLPAARSMSEIATDLCRSTSSLAGSLGSDLSRSTSSHSLPSLSNSRYDLTVEQADSMKAERDMYRALRARKEALEECLREKTAQLKLLCLQEGELTGELPRDTPLSPGEQPPVFRRRVGTAFSLSVKNIQDTDQLSSELSKLELEVELQAKITAAAHKLANDKSVSKYVRKQRRQSYTKAIGKLKDMEKKLDDMRKAARKTSSLDHHPGGSFDDHVTVKPSAHVSPSHCMGNIVDEHNHRPALCPSHSSPQLSGNCSTKGDYLASGHKGTSLYSSAFGNRNSSDLDTRGNNSDMLQLSARLKLDGSHDSGFSSANNMYNMYNISSQCKSHYESSDQLSSPTSSESGAVSPLKSHVINDHGPQLEHFGQGTKDESSSYKTPNSSNFQYGSLDRRRQDNNHIVYRDKSPFRHMAKQDGSNSVSINDLGNADGCKDVMYLGGSVTEVQPNQDVSPLSSGKETWSDASATSLLRQSSNNDKPKQEISALTTSSLTINHCNNPCMNPDYTHVNASTSDIHHKDHHDFDIKHHSALQPGLSRRERSISPFRTKHCVAQLCQQQNERLTIPTGFSGAQMFPQQQPFHHHQQKATSPTHHQLSPTGGCFFPTHTHTVPVRRSEIPVPSQVRQNLYHRKSPVVTRAASPHDRVSHVASTLVTVTGFQPHTEVSKPYETSDFYRYSEKLRRQRIIDQYQRQLIGADLSSELSPLSVDTKRHSPHSGPASSSPMIQSQVNWTTLHPSGLPSPKQTSRKPLQPYTRSASAPLMILQSSCSQKTSPTSSPMQYPLSPSSQRGLSSLFPRRQMSASPIPYSMKSHCPSIQYPTHSSKVQQASSSTKYSMYNPPKPMTCNPVRSSPSTQTSSQRRC